jgi:hypothetical protein
MDKGRMVSEKERSNFAMECNDFAQRAGSALDELVPGPNRDKLVARMFRCSERLAQYLLAGKCWTVKRLSIASAMLGQDFDHLLLGAGRPARQPPSSDELMQRFDHLEEQVQELLTEIRRGQGKWTTRD